MQPRELPHDRGVGRLDADGEAVAFDSGEVETTVTRTFQRANELICWRCPLLVQSRHLKEGHLTLLSVIDDFKGGALLGDLGDDAIEV